MSPVFAEIIGWEFLLVIGIVALLFGSSQIPKFARSIGEASKELKKGMAEGQRDDVPETTPDTPPEPAPEPVAEPTPGATASESDTPPQT